MLEGQLYKRKVSAGLLVLISSICIRLLMMYLFYKQFIEVPSDLAEEHYEE